MQRKFLTAAVIGMVASLGIGGASAALAGSRAHASTTLTIWLMTGEISAKTYGAVDQAFEAAHPGVSVNVQIQQWSGIATKLVTALASSSPPDAMEIGNTDVAEFAASGGLEDLSSVKTSLAQGGTWLSGLQVPAEYRGGLYAIPMLAGDRVVLYNQAMFKQAGIMSPPSSISQLLQDGQLLKKTFAKVSDFSPLYFPGEYWYAGLPLLWEYGGTIARQTQLGWLGTLTTKGSVRGLQEFKTIQNTLSTKASRDVNTNDPDQDSVFANGKAAMIIAGGWEPGVIYTDNPKLKGKIGAFAFPGVKAGTQSPVFLGGSDIAIANNSPNKALALAWVKLMTSPKYQTLMVKNDGLMPNATSLLGLMDQNPLQKVFYAAATDSRGTPASPGWASVEADNTIQNLFEAIATGQQSVKQAAASIDTQLNSLLNQH